MKNIIKNNILYIYVLIFLIISYLSIYQSSILSNSIEKLEYKQLIWYFIGILFIIIIKHIKMEKIYKYSLFIYIINIILLFFLFPFGKEVNNSKSWFIIGPISIQPSEFMKISIILLDSYIINKFYKKKDKIPLKKEIKLLIILFIVFLIPSILTFLQPDTGAVIGYFIITISMIYFSKINKRWLNYFFISILLLIIIFFFIYFNYQDLFINIFGSSFFYRIDRLINWHTRSGIQLNNSLIAIGSSGFLGHKKIPIYYPEAETDFIFTSFTSTYGFIGGLFLIIIVFSFDFYIINQIKEINKKEDKITLFAIVCLFIYQHIQSIGMTLGILPIMGITLPLISYGGSSILSFLILIGIMNNIMD